MRNFRTSKSRVKYYHDINVETKKWEVIELPTNNVIITYDFEEDAKETAIELNKNKPFGDRGFPNFLTHK
tara:strand:- start:210 stop:419 length:210 start_codon:yes stop_codon:yes gene_type:complete